jgi:ABC-type uncharacterized transport system auxiliary subunit
MRRAAFLLLVLGLAACSLPQVEPLPREHYYRLAPAKPSKPFAHAPLQGVMVVETPRGSGLYAGQAILYSEDPPFLEVQHYHYHRWAETPGKLMQGRIVEYLREAKVASTVTQEAGRARADWRVSGRTRRFERIRDDKGWHAVVALDLRVDAADTEPDQEPLLVREYEAIVPAKASDMDASVVAFSAATTQVLDRFLADLAVSLASRAPLPAKDDAPASPTEAEPAAEAAPDPATP